MRTMNRPSRMGSQSAALLVYSPGILTLLLHHFYHALTVAALYPAATAEEKSHYDQVLLKKQKRLDGWAETSPETFSTRPICSPPRSPA